MLAPRSEHAVPCLTAAVAQRRLCQRAQQLPPSTVKLEKLPLRASEDAAPPGEGGDAAPVPLSTAVNRAIDRIGLGRFHYVAAAICGLANAADAVELLCISFILPELSAEGVSSEDEGVLAAAVFVGMLIGGLAMGFASDRSGRRRMLTLSLFINAFFGALSAAAPNWPTLALCRVVAGVGVGGSIPAVFTLFTELLPTYRRGFMINLIAWQWMVGTLYAAGMAWVVIGEAGLSWRVYAALCALPAATACALTWFVLPESPRFLARKVPAAPRGGGGYAGVALSSVSLEGEGGGASSSVHAPSSALTDAAGVVIAAASSSTTTSERASLLATGSSSGAGALPSPPPSPSRPAPPTVRARWAVRAPQTFSVACAGVLRHMAAKNGVAVDAELAALLEGIEGREPALGPGPVGRRRTTPALPLGLRVRRWWASVKSCPRRSNAAWRHPRSGGINLFRPPYRRTTALLLVVWAALSLGWYSLNVWLPQLLSDAQVALSPHNASFLAAAAALPGNILTGLLIDRLGRKKLMVVSLALAAGFAACFAAAQEQWQMLLASCLLNCVSVGSWNTLDSLSVESFPTRLRTTAMGLLAAAGRLGSITGQIAFGQMIHGNRVGLLVTACLALLGGAIAGWALPKEHTGKALEEGGEEGEEEEEEEEGDGVDSVSLTDATPLTSPPPHPSATAP